MLTDSDLSQIEGSIFQINLQPQDLFVENARILFRGSPMKQCHPIGNVVLLSTLVPTFLLCLTHVLVVLSCLFVVGKSVRFAGIGNCLVPAANKIFPEKMNHRKIGVANGFITIIRRFKQRINLYLVVPP